MMLRGLLTMKLVEVQHIYYEELGSRKTGNRQETNLINNFWIIIHQHWVHRNEILHEIEAKDNCSGIEALKEAIAYEYEFDLDSLPYVYSSYFLLPLSIILLK